MDPAPQQQQAEEAAPMIRRLSWTKLILIAVLGGMCLFLQVTVWTLEVLLEERRSSAGGQQPATTLDQLEDEAKRKAAAENSQTTTKPIDLLDELHLQRVLDTAPHGHSSRTQAQAYWKQAAQLWLASWDPHVVTPQQAFDDAAAAEDDDANSLYLSSSSWWDEISSSSINATRMAWFALEQAAELGHPAAQFHVANALAAGLFVPSSEGVQDVWTAPESPQQQRAWLLWHMAAIGGNVEAMMAMATRLSDHNPPHECPTLLPYYQEAALGIMDALELDPQSRAKVLPATDKHVLYQIHLHGGTPSKLDIYNKADESVEALQFYHLRAYSRRATAETAAGAAYTLANYYHYGVRGVTQNLTLAAQYYERAANLNHWEAAGEVGLMYLWGIGVKQDAYKAHKLFRMGMPLGIVGCQRRHQAKLSKSKDDTSTAADLSLCDTESINGMGLLKLMGLPHVMKVDVNQAEELFGMARDQGSADAAYNYAMVKLGWTQHWQPPASSDKSSSSSSSSQQTTSVKETVFPMSGRNSPQDHPTLSEYQSAMTDLTMAAGKGHLQARLRLGLLFANGVQIPEAKTGQETTVLTTVTAVPQDCGKALKQFKYVCEMASPFRNQRLRAAYKQYMNGDSYASLLNYLAAAETGSTVGLLNAAFLLEQGECLSRTTASPTNTGSDGGFTTNSPSPSTPSFPMLSSVDCAKASARLWKQAANKGYGEASLRVGDFYYYQKFRETTHAGVAAGLSTVGPFGWFRYILYPEHSLVILWQHLLEWGLRAYERAVLYLLEGDSAALNGSGNVAGGSDGKVEDQVCQVDEQNQQCQKENADEGGSAAELASDLEMAAHYYRMATESGDTARAHFNLGFLYEWGLGLKQDFPLAKRHYDLAVSSGNGNSEAEIPVALALWAMGVHEKCLKLWVATQDWWLDQQGSPATSNRQKAFRNAAVANVFLSHLWSGESLAVLLLTVALFVVVRIRENNHQRR